MRATSAAFHRHFGEFPKRREPLIDLVEPGSAASHSGERPIGATCHTAQLKSDGGTPDELHVDESIGVDRGAGDPTVPSGEYLGAGSDVQGSTSWPPFSCHGGSSTATFPTRYTSPSAAGEDRLAG